MWDPTQESRGGPGVPDALPRLLRELRDAGDPASIDRLWIFPPIVRGRREWGLVAFTRFLEATGEEGGGVVADDPRRRVSTARYTAEETGKGIAFESRTAEEGVAPDDRLARVIAGVVRRSDVEPGDPREVLVGGDPAALEMVIQEVSPEAPSSGVLGSAAAAP